MARYVGRENVRKRLSALEEGRVVYADGAARIETPDETITVRPPFGLAHARVYKRLELGPLFQALAVDQVLARLELPAPTLQRFFTTGDPRQRDLERLPYDLYAAEIS